ncbi:MAG: hypothetical protein GKR91_09235 [Pseudomonadales bacterium]|nr:hypothetical protein [Pseudomonadales bacterium]
MVIVLQILSCSVGYGQTNLSVDQVLEHHTAALGGDEAISAINNLRIQLEITEPDLTLRGDYRASREGFMRIDIYIRDERVFSEGIDEQGGWQQFGVGTAIESLTDQGFLALKQGIDFNLNYLFDLANRGHQLEGMDRFAHKGVYYYRLKLLLNDGLEGHYYVNPESWMIDYSRESSALHPDIDPTTKPVESFFSEFIEFCGLIRNRETYTIDLISGEQIQQSTITDFYCNLDFDDLEIRRPD